MPADLLHLFWDSDLRGRQPSLNTQAKKIADIEAKDLKPGECLVFINRAKTAVVILGAVNENDTQGVMGYYKSPHGQIDPLAIQYIAAAFGGRRFTMDEALRQALLDRLKRKRRSS